MYFASHTERPPIPFPTNDDIEVTDDDPNCPNSAAEENYVKDDDAFEPHKFSQAELNEIVRDLSFSKDKAELLSSRLNEKNLLKQRVRITYFRERNVALQTCFSVDGPLCFCSDIDELFKCLSLTHDPAEWRLFIDSSKQNLKALPLQNGNLKPSIPTAHSFHLQESYENINLLLHTINYERDIWRFKSHWNVDGDAVRFYKILLFLVYRG